MSFVNLNRTMAVTTKMLVTAGVILMIISTQPTVKCAFKYDHRQINDGGGDSGGLIENHHHNLQRHHPHRHHHNQHNHLHPTHRSRHLNVSHLTHSSVSSSASQRYYHQNGRDVNKYLQWFDDRRINRALLHFKTSSTTTTTTTTTTKPTTIRPRIRYHHSSPTTSPNLIYSAKGHLSSSDSSFSPKFIDNNAIQLRQSQHVNRQKTDRNIEENIEDDDDNSKNDDDYYYYDDDVDEDNDNDDVNSNKKEFKSRKVDDNRRSAKEEEENDYNDKRSEYNWHQYQHEQLRPKYTEDYNYHDYPDDEPSNSEDNPKPGTSLTDYKFQHLGTAEAVQESVRRHRPMQGIRDLAEAHKNMMLVEGQCSQPIPKVVAVPIDDTSKIIVPHCTILHRCGNDSGCCFPHTSECVAKKTEDVYLHFYLIPVFNNNNTNRTSRQPRTIVVRHFINHTECHCVEKSSSASSMMYVGGSGSGVTAPSDAGDSNTLAVINEICRCPNHFDVMQEERGVSYAEQISATRRRRARPRRNLECRCECLSNNQVCLRLKDGHEGFTMEDRRCIKERICTAPICRYGDYDREAGRCPKPKNHKRTISRYDHG